MSQGNAIALKVARAAAERLVAAMQPFCVVAEIAGSIRREKPQVGDIEIVALPRWETRQLPGSLFSDESEDLNLLHEWAVQQSGIHWIKPGTAEIIAWPPKSDGKYWRALLGHDMKLDVFLADHDNFGYQKMLRTGSGLFNQAVARYALNHSLSYSEQALRSKPNIGEPWQQEEDVFRALRLTYVPPCNRRDERDVQMIVDPRQAEK